VLDDGNGKPVAVGDDEADGEALLTTPHNAALTGSDVGELDGAGDAEPIGGSDGLLVGRPGPLGPPAPPNAAAAAEPNTPVVATVRAILTGLFIARGLPAARNRQTGTKLYR